MLRRCLLVIFIIALLLGLALGPFAYGASQTSNNTSVGLTIPTSGSSPPPPPPPPADAAPTISGVSVVVTDTTAQITWSASDDKSITSASFVYGLSTSYGSTGSVSGAYQTSLSGLTPNTTYFYKITVNDSGGHNAINTGSFTTSDADTTPPVISGASVNPGQTTARVSWGTNENATGQVVYGLTSGYGSSATTNLGTSHSATLSNLVPNTTYHYKIIATDSAGNSASTNDATFTTSADTTPPANPSSVAITATTNALVLNWTNPGDADFNGIKVLRKTTGPASGPTDGTLVYSGTGHSLTDTSILSDVTYYYSLFAYDTSNNYSSGVDIQGKITAPTTNEICNDGIDNDSNNRIDCADTACSAFPACAPAETCNNGIDDNNDSRIDCNDLQCSGTNFCAAQSEMCNNGIDDNSNGQTDCDDVACFGFAGCTAVKPSDYTPPPTTVPTFEQLLATDLRFWAANRTIILGINNGTVTSLAGTTLTVGVRKARLPSAPESIIAKLDGSAAYRLAYQSVDDTYYTDLTFPRVGRHQLVVEFDYGSGQFDSLTVTLDSQALGQITNDGEGISDVRVTLVDEQGLAVKNSDLGSAANPTISNLNGNYGWVVPLGRYSVKATKKGFYDRNFPAIMVNNNVVNFSFEMIARPPDLFDGLTTTSTFQENASKLAKNIGAKTKAAAELGLEKAKDAAKIVEEIKKDPEAQEAASTVVAPTVVTVTAVGTVAFISWSSLLPFLRLLFLQPLMLLGLKRRKGWGQVYNTLTKIPVDLATLRLMNAETGKILQSKVTDKEGRYAFIVNPGKYKIQVIKSGFVFPSSLLAKATSDGRRPDIYHGEVIEVAEQEAVITANIPLDPAGEVKRPPRIFWQRVGRTLQISLSWLGLLVTLASLYIAPRWYVWVLLGVHVLLFIIFRRLAVPPKVKSWGIVYDAQTKRPVGRTVARLFNSEFDKLVATQITDGRGRYYFLAGDDKYYVTYDHPEYSTEKTNLLDLTGKEAENIAVDVGLLKGQNQPTPSVTSAAPAVFPTPPLPQPPLASPPPAAQPRIDLNNPPEPPSANKG